MKKVLEFSLYGQKYVVNASDDLIVLINTATNRVEVRCSEHEILNDGKICDNFDRMWAGAGEAVPSDLVNALAIYANGALDASFTTRYACEEFENVRRYLSVRKNAHGVNLKFLAPEGDILTLEYTTLERLAYRSPTADVDYLLSSDDKNVLTNLNENYYEWTIDSIVNGDTFLYTGENFNSYIEDAKEIYEVSDLNDIRRKN